MPELIDKWEVVNKLIQLENNYNFYKDVWDAQTLYRRICELEIGIGKTPGVTFATDNNVGSKWISVKEHLPQDDLPFGALCEIVQVLLDDGTVTVGWCNRGLKCWYYMPIQATNFVGHGYDKTPVVAWQPLAQPPKGE